MAQRTEPVIPSKNIAKSVNNNEKIYCYFCKLFCDGQGPKRQILGCFYCHLNFITKEGLQSHKAGKHPKEFQREMDSGIGSCVGGNCECSSCKNEFAENLRKRHLEDRIYKCHLCTESFWTEIGIKWHMVAHFKFARLQTSSLKIASRSRKVSKDKKGVCPICDKVFKYSRNLSTHMRIHTQEKPYKCSYSGCGKAFTQNSHLKAHIYVHTGETPFKCSFCGRAFSRKHHMEEHLIIHLRENIAIACSTKKVSNNPSV